MVLVCERWGVLDDLLQKASSGVKRVGMSEEFGLCRCWGRCVGAVLEVLV